MENNVDLKEVFKKFSEAKLTGMDNEAKDAYIAKFLYALLRS